MKITYCCNSGFQLAQDGILLVFDYIGGSGVPPVTKDFLQGFDRVYVFASHAHSDHYDPVVLKWDEWHGRLAYVFSEDIQRKLGRKIKPGMVFLAPGGSWADEDIRVTAYGSTDEGVSFHVKMGEISLFHAGDLNDWHWKSESTVQEVAAMKKAFTAILDNIEANAGRLDVAMFPVDPRLGQDFHEGADAFIERFSPRLFAPMHFRRDAWAVDTFIGKHPEKAKTIWRIQQPGQSLDFDMDAT